MEKVELQEPVEPDHLFAVKCLSMSTALLQAYFVSLLPSLIQLSWSGVEPVEQVGFQEPVEPDVKVQKVDLIRSFSENLLLREASGQVYFLLYQVCTPLWSSSTCCCFCWTASWSRLMLLLMPLLQDPADASAQPQPPTYSFSSVCSGHSSLV